MHKLVVAAVLAGTLGPTSARPARDEPLASLGSAAAWLNSPPLTAAGLRGKVVLIDFWTFSCINSLRTLPHVRAWAEKYKDQGLVVIGVHAPEFGFEHNLDNVRRAVNDLRVPYPVALDNDFKIWQAFDNSSWPALYFVDAQGKLRHDQLGEGDNEESERVIQQLLAEAGATGISRDLVAPQARGAEAPADWSSLQSPESYAGYARGENLASPGGAARDTRKAYRIPAGLELNQWALAGEWTIGKEATLLHQANGKIAYRFHARDLHLVMGPARGSAARFRVLLDGKPPGAAHGSDVDEQGYGMAREQRMFQLIRQSKPIADRVFTIEFLDPGVEVFVFTFG